MKVAVTGSTGFVGRHVLNALAGTGCRVIALARDPSRVLGPFDDVIQWDIGSNPKGIYNSIGRPDTVIHLAWEGLPNYTAENHISVELPKQWTFLKALVEDGLSCLFVAGSCLEYGSTEGSLNELIPASPTTAYGSAKNRLRELLEAAMMKYRFRLVWGRLFYLFGSGQNPKSLFGQFSRALTEGQTCFDMSPGDQLRDYLPVEEASRMIVKLSLCPAAGGIINICSGTPVEVRALVESWLRLNGSSMRMNLGKLPHSSYESRRFWGDRSKLDRVLHEC
jgi:dTDP-6-deoxy-L-talose 4-dehydrogenase (NAD+)